MSQSPNSWEDAAQDAVNEADKMLWSIRSITSRISPLKWTTAKSLITGLTQRSRLIWAVRN